MDKHEKKDLNKRLMAAAVEGDAAEVAALVKKGANVHARDNKRLTAAHWAAIHNRPEVIQVLKENGADLNAQADYKRTPLHYAVRNGHAESTRALINAGADIEARDDRLQRPLRYAVCSDSYNPQVFQMLLDAKVDLNAGDRMGNAAIHHTRGKALKALIAAGADRNKQGLGGNTALGLKAMSGNLSDISILINNGSDVNQGQPLVGAAAHGHADAAEYLIKAGANIDAPSLLFTPLCIAVQNDQDQMVHLLLKHGANPSAPDPRGAGPLHYAAATGKSKFVKILLDAGADANAIDEDGKTPRQELESNKHLAQQHPELIALLKEAETKTAAGKEDLKAKPIEPKSLSPDSDDIRKRQGRGRGRSEKEE